MNTIKLKKGLDIEISGKAALKTTVVKTTEEVGIIPDNFEGITPKVAVKEGDTVKAGSVLLFAKHHPELKIVSPVSGTVTSVARGDRRKLLYVSVKPDAETAYESFPKVDVAKASREEVLTAILNGGFAAFVKQRPYNVVMNPTLTPKSIFISAFDSAPLATDYSYTLKGKADDVQTGLFALAKLTDGKVYYSVSPKTSDELKNMKGVEVTEFVGPHPAGLVGVQINHLDPINKDEIVWTMNVQDVAMMGRFLKTGKADFTKVVALVGPKVKEPAYYEMVLGTKVGVIIKGKLEEKTSLRVIDGNVLTGVKADNNEFVSAFSNEITVIEEGDHADELFGWIAPRFNMFSNSKLFMSTYLRKLFNKQTFKFDARVLGGERAFIMSNELEPVFPMDILPEQLVKAMIAKNIDKMEALGAYEVVPEDFALCEYVCSSKIEIQKIVHESLDFMRKELE